jgi:hypothetical protein
MPGTATNIITTYAPKGNILLNKSNNIDRVTNTFLDSGEIIVGCSSVIGHDIYPVRGNSFSQNNKESITARKKIQTKSKQYQHQPKLPTSTKTPFSHAKIRHINERGAEYTKFLKSGQYEFEKFFRSYFLSYEPNEGV